MEQEPIVVDEKTSLRIGLRELIAIIAFIVFAAGLVFVLQQHVANTVIHHTVDQLDTRYMTRELTQQKLDEIMRVLDRIERDVKERER